MDPEFEIATQPATPEFVLKVFQDWHRQASAMFEADPEFELSFDSTIDEWREGYDLAEWKEFARAMNAFWEIEVPLREWKQCLTPARKRRVIDVCELIARHARVPTIRPLRILDRDCLPGGAFLTVKAMLKKAGADVEHLGPSTNLSKYATRFLSVFLGGVSQLAPGALPAIEADLRFPGGTLGCAGIALFFVAVPFVGLLWPVAVPLALGGMFFFLKGCLKAATPPKPVTFGNLKTFKDLAKLLAANQAGK